MQLWTKNFWNKYHKKPVLWSNKLSYLAGIIDGEGYIKIEKWGTIRITVSMTDKNVIKWIYNNFGGVYTVQKRKTVTGKIIYTWRMNQTRDLLFLMFMIIPYLIVKRKKVIDSLKKLLTKMGKLEHTNYPFNWRIQKFHT